MQIKTKAFLIAAVSKPYDFEGRSGTSHRVRINVEGEVYVCKSSAIQVAELAKYEKTEGTAVFEISSPQERLTMELKEFTPVK